jgi:hypothetical protein
MRRGMGYPCPFDRTGKYLGDALHLLTQKRKMDEGEEFHLFRRIQRR